MEKLIGFISVVMCWLDSDNGYRALAAQPLRTHPPHRCKKRLKMQLVWVCQTPRPGCLIRFYLEPKPKPAEDNKAAVDLQGPKESWNLREGTLLRRGDASLYLSPYTTRRAVLLAGGSR